MEANSLRTMFSRVFRLGICLLAAFDRNHKSLHVVVEYSTRTTASTQSTMIASKLHRCTARCCQSRLLSIPTGSLPLGTPLPSDSHACSVSLPTWKDVVGYEEGDSSVLQALRCGYPRFVYHPYVAQLMDAVRGTGDALLLPSPEAATRCAAFLAQALYKEPQKDNCWIQVDDWSDTNKIRIVPVDAEDVYAVLFPAETAAAVQAKAYWQHTGEVVSSRRAERALRQLGHHVEAVVENDYCRGERCSSVFTKLQERIADWAKVEPDHVFLTPSGMSSIYTALRSARRYCDTGTTVVYGFPYLDTLKLASRPEISPRVEFFGHGHANDLESLRRLVQTERITALITEVPSNPLLQCPDMLQLRQLADKHDFCLIVDDTIANWQNVDLISTGLADVVCTSLTKLVSGRGDVLAGSLVVNPNTPKGRWMLADLKQHETKTDLHVADAHALYENSGDFLERSEKINETSVRLAEWLSNHTAVKDVYYPTGSKTYESIRANGYGGLLSMIVHPHMCQRHFYDELQVAKGPSLGTNFTLVCPYTLLAHYHELDFAMSYGVPPNLIRVAVGLESFDELQEKFDRALSKSQLYPKPSLQQVRTLCTSSNSGCRGTLRTERKSSLLGLSRQLVR